VANEGTQETLQEIQRSDEPADVKKRITECRITTEVATLYSVKCDLCGSSLHNARSLDGVQEWIGEHLHDPEHPTIRDKDRNRYVAGDDYE